MLEKLRLIFSKAEPETSAGLLAAREELEVARVAAVEELRRVQAEKNAALVEAIAADDDKARASLRKSLAAAQAELDEITGALAGLDARIEQARTTEAAQAAVEDAAQRAALARQREEAASAMQHALENLAAAFARFDALGRRIEGKLTRRHIEARAVSDFDLVAAVSEQLQCRTAGRLGDPRVLRTFTLHEFQRAGLLVDLPELAQRQNARLGLIAPEVREAA